MLERIEQRRTEPAGRDDPAELAARLDKLRAQVTAAAGTAPGGWQTVGAEQAARQLAARGADRGVDLDAARAMVAGYLRETSDRVGAPAQEWGLDQGDLDAIAADHRLPTTLPAVAAVAGADQDAGELDRAQQLAAWHTYDTAGLAEDGVDDASLGDAAVGDASVGDAADAGADGVVDGAGWSQ
jgi:hypothetical protein